MNTQTKSKEIFHADDAQEILKLVCPSSANVDKLISLSAKNGIFSVKFATAALLSHVDTNFQDMEMWTTRWKHKAPQLL